MNQTAVVFGATGLVGKELVYELLETNAFLKVIAIVRNTLPLSHGRLEQLKINDFTDVAKYKDKLNADVFFCCIGTTIKKAGSQDAFRKVDYNIPFQIAQLASTLNVQSLVIISSIGASATTSNFYLRTKGEMEKAVQEIYKGNLKIVRPSLLMGHRAEFRLAEKISTVIMKALGIFMFGPLKKYKAIYAWDVARAMIKSIALPKEKTIIESDELAQLGKKK
jgi:uncharacterized protein YbjT (DUF2867 family)